MKMYKFPIIKHIDEFRSVLQKTPQSYFETDKGLYTSFNYVSISPEIFPPIRTEEDKYIREARGIAFLNETGEIISRPIAKFFNFGERDEDHIDVFEFEGSLFEAKEDGSMIHALNLPLGFRLATRAGITDISLKAEALIATNMVYQRFINECLRSNLTPIFEYVAPDNKIVIKYDQPELILLDTRHMITGQYFGTSFAPTSIPTPKKYSNVSLEQIRSWEDREGVVVKLVNGFRVKIKADLYVKLHRYVDILKSDRHFVKALFSETWDDIYSNSTPEVKETLKEGRRRFNQIVEMLSVHLVFSLFDEFGPVVNKENRRQFAEWVFATHKNWSSVVFKIGDAMTNGEDDPVRLIDVGSFWISRSIANKAGSEKDWNTNNIMSDVNLLGENDNE